MWFSISPAYPHIISAATSFFAFAQVLITRKESEEIWEKFENRIYWRTIFADFKDSKWKIIWASWSVIDHNLVKIIEKEQINEVEVRSIITCHTWNWVCKKCYWVDLWNNQEVEYWTPVWIIAAQAIWEPGTQLTMRTFHSWWVASEWGDITQGLTRVEELFEAKPPKTPAVLAWIWWKVKVHSDNIWKTVTIEETELWKDEYFISDEFEIVVKKWEEVKEKQVIWKSRFNKNLIKVKIEWTVENIKDWIVVIKHSKKEQRTYNFKPWELIKVDNWDVITKWTSLNSGHCDLKELVEITNMYWTQKYIVNEVQSIYAQQWQVINDKHIEIIVKQMFSKVRIVDNWDTTFLPWEVTDITKFERINKEAKEKKLKRATWERLLLWLTRLALATDSWLSAASFQETIRVLVEASTTRKIDHLEWLKENVIIWKLIPVWKTYKNSMERIQAKLEGKEVDIELEVEDA